jgi:hypothetical protein
MCRGKPDRQSFERVQRFDGPPLRLVGFELEVGQVDECSESDLCLRASEWSAEAVVGAGAEGNVAASVAGDVECVG